MDWKPFVCMTIQCLCTLNFVGGQTGLMGWNTIDTGYVEYTTPITPGVTDASVVTGGGVDQSQVVDTNVVSNSGAGNYYDWFTSGSGSPSFKYVIPAETTTQRTTTTTFQPTTISLQKNSHRQIFAAPKKLSFSAKIRNQKPKKVQSGTSERDGNSNGNWVHQKENNGQSFNPTTKPQSKTEWVGKPNEKRGHRDLNRRRDGGWQTIDNKEKISSQPRHQAQSFKDLKIDVTKTSTNQFKIKLNKPNSSKHNKENENGLTHSAASNGNGQRIVAASLSQPQEARLSHDRFTDTPNTRHEESHHSGIEHKRTTFPPNHHRGNYPPSATDWKVIDSDRNQQNRYQRKDNSHQRPSNLQRALPEWQSASYNSRNQQQIGTQPERSQILSQPVVRQRLPSKMDNEPPYSSPQQPEVRTRPPSKMDREPHYSSSQQQSLDKPRQQSPFFNQNDNFSKQPPLNNNYIEQPPPRSNYNKQNPPQNSNYIRKSPNDQRQSRNQYDNVIRQISTLLKQQQLLQKQHQDWQKNQLNIQKRQQQLQRESLGVVKKFTSTVDGIIPIFKTMDKGIKKMHTMIGNFLAAV